MNIAVRYQSRGGNTRAVAEAIANAAGVTAEPIGTPLTEAVDLLFLGGGVYAHDMSKDLRSYLADVDPALVKSVAAFSTGGAMSVTDKIADAAGARGIPVCGETLSFKMGIKNYHLFGPMGRPTLTRKQLADIDDFVQRATSP